MQAAHQNHKNLRKHRNRQIQEPEDTQEQNEPQQKEELSTAVEPSTGSTTQRDTELTVLRNTITENNSMLGVSFLGYVSSEDDENAVREYINNSVLAQNYHFLKEASTVLLEGAELYVFVPANDNITITVYNAEPSEDGTRIERGNTPVYTGKAGETIVLRCNLSEIYSNVMISATDGTKTLEFQPIISLENGQMVHEQGCYDITVYGNDDLAVERAAERLLENAEIKAAIEKGKSLMYTGDMQNIDGMQCFVFALGTDNEDQFVREEYYAVSDNLIYAYYPEQDSWEILGLE